MKSEKGSKRRVAKPTMKILGALFIYQLLPLQTALAEVCEPTIRPCILWPEEGIKTADTTPRFYWSGFNDASRYRVALTQNAQHIYLPEPLPVETNYTGDALQAGECYRLDVRPEFADGSVGNWSYPRNFCVVDPIAEPTAVSPLNSSYEIPQSLVWNSVENAAYYQVDLWLGPSTSNENYRLHSMTRITGNSYTLPSNIELSSGNTYTWRVRAYLNGNEHGAWASTSFSILESEPLTAPTPMLPDGNTSIDSPRFQWAGTIGASSYSFELYKDGVKLDVPSTYTTSNFPYQGNLGLGCYSWRVKAQGPLAPDSAWSSQKPFCVVEPVTAPTNLTPNGNITDLSPDLTWQADPRASKHKIQITSPDGAYVYKWQDGLTTNQYTLPSDVIFEVGSCYRWSVRSYLNDYEHSNYAYSDICIQSDVQLETPAPLDPFISTTQITPVLNWISVAGAESYLFEIQQNGQLVEPQAQVSASLYEVTTLLTPGETYSWRVKALSSLQPDSGWSNWQQFEVIDKLEAPVVDGPAGLINDVSPSFTWLAVENALFYKVQILKGNSVIHNLERVENTVVNLPPEQSLQDLQSYSWKVRAYANDTDHGPWTTSDFAINTSAVKLATPADTFPKGNIFHADTALKWSEVELAEKYLLEITDIETSAPFIEPEPETDALRYYLPELSVNQCLSWRVKAVAQGQIDSDWSESNRFCLIERDCTKNFSGSCATTKTGTDYSGLATRVTPYASDSNLLGATHSAPYININEYTGKVSSTLPTGIPEGFGLGLNYKAPNRVDSAFNNRWVYSDTYENSSTGIGWRLDYGFLVVQKGVAKLDHGWEQVARIDGAGNLSHFTRDQMFQNLSGLQPQGLGNSPVRGDECYELKCWPMIEDMHFIDSAMNRITHSKGAFDNRTYYLLEPSGRKIAYRAERKIEDPQLGHILRFYPERIEQPNGDYLEIKYVTSTTPLGQFEHPKIDYIEDRWGRRVHYHYNESEFVEQPVLERLTLEQDGAVETLVNFKYVAKTRYLHDEVSLHLSQVITPTGEIFSIFSDYYFGSRFPLLNKLTLPQGGTVNVDYGRVTTNVILSTDPEPGRYDKANFCERSGQLESETWTRVKQISYMDGTYNFDYAQVDSAERFMGLWRTVVTGPENYSRSTYFYDQHSMEKNTATHCDQDSDLFGKPLARFEYYNGTAKEERWTYTSKFILPDEEHNISQTRNLHFGNIGGTVKSGSIQMPLVTSYRASEIQAQGLAACMDSNTGILSTDELSCLQSNYDTQYHEPARLYSDRTEFYFDSVQNNENYNAKDDLFFPTEIIKSHFVLDQNSGSLTRAEQKRKQYFDYQHRWAPNSSLVQFDECAFGSQVNGEFETCLFDFNYMLGLSTAETHEYIDSTQVQTLNKWQIAYHNTFGVPVQTTQYKSGAYNDVVENIYEYYGSGAYKGYLKRAYTVDQEGNYNASQYADAVYAYKNGVPVSIKRQLPCTDANSCASNVTTIFDSNVVDIRGNVKSSKANGVMSYARFDVAGRQVASWLEGRVPAVTQYTKDYLGFARSIEKGWGSLGDHSNLTTVLSQSAFDTWGRTTKDKIVHQHVDGLQEVAGYQLNEYSGIGLLSKQTTGLCRYSDIDSCTVTDNTYDVFGRILTAVTSDGGSELRRTEYQYKRNVTNGYAETIVTSTEAGSMPVTKSTVVDFLGRQIEARVNGVTTADVEYSWVNGLLKKVVKPAGIEDIYARESTFDWLGNLISEKHPEIQQNISYQYNSKGLLSEVISGDERKVFHRNFDDTIDYIDCHNGAETLVCQSYLYGSENGSHRLLAKTNKGAADDLVTTRYSGFTAEGLPKYLTYRAMLQDIQGAEIDKSFQITMDYNNYGQMSSMQLPLSNKAVDYEHSLSGQQQSVSWVSGPIAAAKFDERGAVASLLFGSTNTSELENCASYTCSRNEFDSLGRIKQSGLFVQGAQEYGYQGIRYNSNNQIVSYAKSDNYTRSPASYSFKYKATGPLESFTTNGQTVSYDYDKYGNLISRSDLANGKYQLPDYSTSVSANPYQLEGWEVNQQGRVIYDAERQLTFDYDANGRIAAQTSSSNAELNSQFIYDAEGNRFATVKGGQIKYSIRDLSGNVVSELTYDVADTANPVAQTEFVYQNGALVLSSDLNEGDKFHFQGLRGSGAVTFNGDGSSIVKRHYSPYGLLMSSGDAAKGVGGYTGHENDDSGLVYMKARYMSPNSGRFLTPDPARDFNLFNPHSYNLYSYVGSDPINLVDPTGMMSCQSNGDCPKDETAEGGELDVNGLGIVISFLGVENETMTWEDSNTHQSAVEQSTGYSGTVGPSDLLPINGGVSVKGFILSGDTEVTGDVSFGFAKIIEITFKVGLRTEKPATSEEVNFDTEFLGPVFSAGRNSNDGPYIGARLSTDMLDVGVKSKVESVRPSGMSQCKPTCHSSGRAEAIPSSPYKSMVTYLSYTFQKDE